MRRACRLAAIGTGTTWPNPSVGCVLVRDNQCIGSGRTAPCGGPHAEVQALAACTEDPHGATAYVTLAPCTQHGRTPPCFEALVQAGIQRIVVACTDPNQDDLTSRCAEHNISYDTGCEKDLAAFIQGGFLSRIEKGRPRFTGKWAMTIDGYLAAHTGESGWISSQEALVWSRRRRRIYDGILIGSGTAVQDNPRLLSSVPGRTPVRIVVSAQAQLSPQLLATASQAPVVLLHDQGTVISTALQKSAVECLPCLDTHNPELVGQALGGYGLNDVLVEGGSHIHHSFLAAGLYDRLEIQVGTTTLAGGTSIAQGIGVDRIELGTRWQLETEAVTRGETVCLRYRKTEASCI